jgi:hypothetical protein
LFAIASSKLPDQAQRAAIVVEKMNANGVVPDDFTRRAVAKYRSLLSSITNYS